MNVTDFRECGAACAAKDKAKTKEPPVSQEMPGNLLLLTLYRLSIYVHRHYINYAFNTCTKIVHVLTSICIQS